MRMIYCVDTFFRSGSLKHALLPNHKLEKSWSTCTGFFFWSSSWGNGWPTVGPRSQWIQAQSRQIVELSTIIAWRNELSTHLEISQRSERYPEREDREVYVEGKEVQGEGTMNLVISGSHLRNSWNLAGAHKKHWKGVARRWCVDAWPLRIDPRGKCRGNKIVSGEKLVKPTSRYRYEWFNSPWFATTNMLPFTLYYGCTHGPEQRLKM